MFKQTKIFYFIVSIALVKIILVLINDTKKDDDIISYRWGLANSEIQMRILSDSSLYVRDDDGEFQLVKSKFVTQTRLKVDSSFSSPEIEIDTSLPNKKIGDYTYLSLQHNHTGEFTLTEFYRETIDENIVEFVLEGKLEIVEGSLANFENGKFIKVKYDSLSLIKHKNQMIGLINQTLSELARPKSYIDYLREVPELDTAKSHIINNNRIEIPTFPNPEILISKDSILYYSDKKINVEIIMNMFLEIPVR